MKTDNIQKKIPGRIFNNTILESFTKSSPVITNVFYLSLVVLFLIENHFYGSLKMQNIGLTFASGLMFWTLFEYLMHRYLFHLISKKKWINRLSFMLHGIHHQNPRDQERFFMPPIPGSIIIGILFGLSYLAINNYSYCFMAGLLLGYVLYTQIHFRIHANKIPKYLKKTATHHLLHHHKYPNKAFGVSSSLWDVIFHTMPQNDINRNKGN